MGTKCYKGIFIYIQNSHHLYFLKMSKRDINSNMNDIKGHIIRVIKHSPHLHVYESQFNC